MFLRSLRRSWPLMIAVTLLLVYFTYYYLNGPLIVPPKEFGFIDRSELRIAAIMVPIFAFLLPNKFEIELSLTCGMSTAKLFCTKAITSFIYTAIPSFVFVFLYRYIPYDGKSPWVYAINVPEDYRIHMVISMAVTLLFFFSLICFVRVLSRNCYIPILVGLFVHFTTENNCKGIQSGARAVKNCIFDPFISVYFIGDDVPNAIVENHPQLGLISNAWTCNRLIFLGISVVLLVITYIMLRRENLHRGFGD